MKSKDIFSFLETSKFKFTLAIVCSLFVFIFLLYFQPFGINNYRPDEKLSLTLVLALLLMSLMICMAILICEFFIRPKLFEVKNYTQLSIWLVFEFIFIASITFLYYNSIGGFHDFYFSSYLKHIFSIVIVLIFPFAATLFYFKHTLVIKDYKEVLSITTDSIIRNDMVLLSGDYKKDQIALPLNSIVFIESEDNYASLNYIENDQLKKYLIRSTLKDLETKLDPKIIKRCNRSILINLYHLESFKQTSKALVVKLKFIQSPFLVSKSNRLEIFDIIKDKAL